MGPKKRRLDAVLSDQPSLDGWIEFVRQPGPEGGWSAEITQEPFNHGWTGEPRDDPE